MGIYLLSILSILFIYALLIFLYYKLYIRQIKRRLNDQPLTYKLIDFRQFFWGTFIIVFMSCSILLTIGIIKSQPETIYLSENLSEYDGNRILGEIKTKLKPDDGKIYIDQHSSFIVCDNKFEKFQGWYVHLVVLQNHKIKHYSITYNKKEEELNIQKQSPHLEITLKDLSSLSTIDSTILNLKKLTLDDIPQKFRPLKASYSFIISDFSEKSSISIPQNEETTTLLMDQNKFKELNQNDQIPSSTYVQYTVSFSKNKDGYTIGDLPNRIYFIEVKE